MRNGLLAALLLVAAASAQPSKEKAGSKPEAAEDKARTVPGGASLGVKRCHKDIELFCKDVEAGEGRIGKCLKANGKKLSKPCERWLAHGGPEHRARAFQEIDASTVTAPVSVKP